MDLNDLNKVSEVKPMKKVREDEAWEILEKVAKQVQPIMRKRKWKVNTLSEFWYWHSLIEMIVIRDFMILCFQGELGVKKELREMLPVIVFKESFSVTDICNFSVYIIVLFYI